MSTTTLKLPPELKRRVASLVRGTDKSAHAFMVDAIAKEAERAELRRKFIADALSSLEHAEHTGLAYDAKEVHSYFAARAAGRPSKRPRLRRWRK